MFQVRSVAYVSGLGTQRLGLESLNVGVISDRHRRGLWSMR
jgi:hypothetical protein